ncbi:MAG TPA: SH3 domain-containing protein [Terriglobales bacterium]|nr:SH3 domain-containing protein [Terriglobales bacterium]
MRHEDGKFILLDIDAFASWLHGTSFSRVIKLLQVHHTFQPDYHTFDRVKDHFALLKSMERSHVIERGFSEVAQNLTTFPDGRVAVCRPIDNIPAGIKGANQHGICVENLGNFDLNQDVMTPEHRNCIIKVFAHLCRRFTLDANSDSIQYHHWWDLNTGKRSNGTGTTKTCPGTQFFSGNTVASAEANFIPQVRQELAAMAAAGPVPPPQPAYAAEVAVDFLNVRALPSTSAVVLNNLHLGVEVCVYEARNGWSRIDPVNSCWVDSRFLLTVPAPVKASRLYSAQVTTDLLNVRSLPSLAGAVLHQLTQGAVVNVYEEHDEWRRIDEVNSLWVCGRYLAKAAAVTA